MKIKTREHNHRSPEAAGFRMTDRDRQALRLVAELRAVRRDDVGVMLATLAGRGAHRLGPRTTRDVIARWTSQGLVVTEPYPGQGPAVVLPTPRTAALAHLGRPKPPSWTDTPHTLTTAAVAGFYLARLGGEWQSELRLRGILPRTEHLPDGVWHPPADAPPVAVEVERNGKSAERWAAIAGQLLSNYHRVDYWLSPETLPVWQRWASENLPEAARARVGVYSIEQNGLAR